MAFGRVSPSATRQVSANNRCELQGVSF